MGKRNQKLKSQPIPKWTRCSSGSTPSLPHSISNLFSSQGGVAFFIAAASLFVTPFATNTAFAQALDETQFRARLEQDRRAQADLINGNGGKTALNRDLYTNSTGGARAGSPRPSAVAPLPALADGGVQSAAQAAASSDAQNRIIGEEAYGESRALSLPLSPGQIRDITQGLEATREASRPAINSIPETSTQDLDMRPGSPPPIVRIASLHGATVNFIDSLGNAWPIKAITNFNQRDFSIDVPFAGASTLTISNLGFYGTGNVAVFLEGLDMPVTVGLYGGQKVTDYRVDFRILKRKPGAVEPVPVNGTSAATFDSRLNRLVDGVPPEGGTRLRASSPFVEAYQLDDMLVLRTQLTLLSGFTTKIPAADGTTVYALAMTPAITVSENGKPKLIQIDY